MRRERGRRGPIIGFNPCFDGSVERGPPTRTLPYPRGVSILVLMEVLREVTASLSGGEKHGVSILVLMEVLREAYPRSESDTSDRGFQSLF